MRHAASLFLRTIFGEFVWIVAQLSKRYLFIRKVSRRDEIRNVIIDVEEIDLKERYAK